MIPHEIVVHTSDKKWAGTNADVYVRLRGSKAESKTISLAKDKDERSMRFERGQIDSFKVDVSRQPHKCDININDHNKHLAFISLDDNIQLLSLILLFLLIR